MSKKILFFVLLAIVAAAGVGAAGETGKVSGKWIPPPIGAINGGLVCLFNAATGPPPSLDGYLRVPDVIGAVEDGLFSMQVAPGTYYLATIKKADNIAGPPQEGDLYSFSRNPNSEPRTYTVIPGGNVEVGTIVEALTYKRGQGKGTENPTTIEGVVSDEEGNPVAGSRVLAYPTPDMSGAPLYVSEGSGADGRYILRVFAGGTYYLKIRNHYGGGKPETGEIMGGYGEQRAPAGVTVEYRKRKTGIDIKGKKFRGRGSEE